ncbi:hypothetical protein [Paracoccus sp. ME4]|uniref:hypothetical protein n=1 Tax=Paracoccus sp. ME4 TaxID=3138066 RepID=UPI00398A885B
MDGLFDIIAEAALGIAEVFVTSERTRDDAKATVPGAAGTKDWFAPPKDHDRA